MDHTADLLSAAQAVLPGGVCASLRTASGFCRGMNITTAPASSGSAIKIERR